MAQAIALSAPRWAAWGGSASGVAWDAARDELIACRDGIHLSPGA